jgi:hypothetical protein
MGLWNKKITLDYVPDPRLAGAMALPAPVRVVPAPIVDNRPPEHRSNRVGDTKNLFAMRLGGCTVTNGVVPELVAGAFWRGLGVAGIQWVAPGESERNLTLHTWLDICWANMEIGLEAELHASCSVQLQLATDQILYQQVYRGQGYASSVLGITKRHFQQSLTTALAAMVWFGATDPNLAQVLRQPAP